MLVWQRMIRREFFAWISDIRDLGEFMWQPLIGQHLSALDWSGVKVHGFDTGGKYEFKLLF
jgi:hypothetical protein